jgi:hypothetical protein
MKKVILSVIVLAAMLGVLSAAPFQTIGMLRTPDAYVLPHKAAELLLVGYYRDVVRPVYVDEDKNGFIPYGMLGVGLFDRVELGFFGGDSVYFLNAKVKVIQETPKIPQVAIGMDNILSPVNRHRAQDYTPANSTWDYADHPDKSDYEYYSPYFVMSKQAVIGGLSWMFNLGWGSNRYIGQVARSRMFSGTFASIELSPMRDLAIQGEYDGKDFNAGIKYSIKNFSFKVGAEAVEDLAKGSEGNGYEDNLRIALGVSYLFDKYAEAKRRPDLRQYAVDEDLDEIEVVTADDTEITPIEDEVPVEVTTTPDTGTTETPDTGTEVTLVTPGTVVETPGLTTSTSGYKELSPEVKDLLAELRNLREERQKAQKALEDLRKWLQELKAQKKQ